VTWRDGVVCSVSGRRVQVAKQVGGLGVSDAAAVEPGADGVVDGDAATAPDGDGGDGEGSVASGGRKNSVAPRKSSVMSLGRKGSVASRRQSMASIVKLAQQARRLSTMPSARKASNASGGADVASVSACCRAPLRVCRLHSFTRTPHTCAQHPLQRAASTPPDDHRRCCCCLSLMLPLLSSLLLSLLLLLLSLLSMLLLSCRLLRSVLCAVRGSTPLLRHVS
jgi:hypothetical protein